MAVMALRIYFVLILALTVRGAPEKELQPVAETDQNKEVQDEKDLKTASSSYSHQYSDWGGRNPGGYEYSVTGNGILEDRVGANYANIGGYNNVGYGANPSYGSGYGGNTGYDRFGQRGYESGNVGGYGFYGGYGKTDGFIGSNAYPGNTRYSGGALGGTVGYGGNSGYNPAGGYGGYAGSGGYGGYAGSGAYSGAGAYGGNGGYGGYGGNGGLTSYYGYNNPYYQGNNHLGYGYQNKRPGYGNIYNNGITPSLVTGYRGYSR